MRIVTILGSPRKRGNTAAILRAFEGLVAPAHEVERIDIVDHTVKGCLGCDACQRVPDRPACVQKDDGVALLERLLAADLIVYASPVYVWSFTAQLKAFIDRHYCTVKWKDNEVAARLLEGKRALLLATCGGGAADNADLIQVEFERQMDYLGSRIVGRYVVDNCTTPPELGERATATAAQMAGDIATLCR